MKKIISTLAMGAMLATAASADFARVEMGAGAWMQTPSGYAKSSDGYAGLNLSGDYVSNEVQATDTYAWLLVKHPLPIIPNIRLEYTTVTDEGKTTGNVNGFNITDPAAPTTIDIKQFDVIPYYNLLDNTFWLTVDVGLDIKVIQSDTYVAATGPFTGYESSDTSVVPLLYLRTRVEIPATNIGIEADGKAITDGTNTLYDARAKIDYTFDFIPVIQPAIEVGYRVQQIKVDDGSSSQVDLNYSGVYAGLMLRF
jgi:outer membrane protein